MNTSLDYRSLAAALVFTGLLSVLFPDTASAAAYTPPANNRGSFNFNYDWKFIKQDVANAKNTVFDDSTWKAVSLPHSWNDDKFREWITVSNSKPADPLLTSSTYYGIAWYRKHFTVDAAYTGRKVYLEFEGIGRCANFYVNGQFVGLYENGVAPCGLDITNFVNFGADNVIAVQVNNSPGYKTVNYNGATLPYGQPFNPIFGGLNRDVTLHIMDKVHQTLPLYRNLGTVGTYVYPTNIDTLNSTAGLTIQTQVENSNTASQSVTCNAVVVDRDGNVVLSASASPQSIAAGQMATVTMTGSMTGIHFWNPDYPYLYQVYTTLTVGGNVVDVCKTPLGVRKYTFSPTFGLQVNGHPIYLKGYAPRTSMEWPCVGTPVDWLNEYDFKLMKDNFANFVRPMHIAPPKVQVEAADKFGIVMVVPAANNEGDDTDVNEWQQRLDIMRDVTIYFRNNPSVLFYEGCNQILTAQHMTDMKNIRLQWDPYGGRLAGLRSNDANVTASIREYGADMDVTGNSTAVPTWDAEFARGEAPRRVWDTSTPVLNPRWDGVNPDPTPFLGTNTTSRFLIGGYYYIASDYHQAFGLSTGTGDYIGDYTVQGYFRLQSSEDMVLENLAKYYARYAASAFLQSGSISTSKGVMVGGAKIIWSDSVTDGRMHDMEVARVSGAVDGARLPKEVFYGLQVVQNPGPQVYVVGHWNYAAGTVKRVYVAANTPQVRLQTFDTSGNLIKDYGYGRLDYFPNTVGPDSKNAYSFAFDNVAWQPGSIKAIGYDSTGKAVATHQKSTVGAPAALRITRVASPSGSWMADGSDIAMFDIEVVDANGNRCPTYEDRVDFTCTGNGVFLGGYNSGIRYSTNVTNLTSGYHFNIECGINRVFVRSTRTAGSFTLNVSRLSGDLTPASITINSAAITNANGLSTVWPQKYAVTLGSEPVAVQEGVPPPPPPPPPSAAPTTSIVDFAYSGANSGATVVTNVQASQQVYMDASGTFTSLPSYLVGGEFIRPYQGDAGEASSTDQYQFNLSRYSYVYQLIDAANDMPAHEYNEKYQWQQMPGQVVVRGRPMNIFKSRLMAPYENCYFATNAHGVTNFDPASNMYLVFVVWAEQQLQSPSQNIVASSTQAPNVAANMIDGNAATRWGASDGSFPQTVKLDLGRQCLIGGYLINWYSNASRAYKYKVEVSDDDVTYNLSVDMQSNTSEGYFETRVPSTGANSGRYVRITVTGSPGWATINEIIVNGIPGVSNGAPTGLSMAVTSSQVALSWNAVDGASGYKVKRATASGGPYTVVGTPTTNNYNDPVTVSGSAVYYYVVSAVTSGTEGPNSTEINTTLYIPPLAPTGLAASASAAQIALSWNPSANATGYNVKRATTSGGPYTTVGSPSTTSYTDLSVANGTTYYYVVSAVNGAGEGSNSSQASATVPLAAVATAINCGGTTLGQFSADIGFTGGTANAKSNTIDLSGATNPAPMAVYQTYRMGSFSYTLGGFTPGQSYTIRLHFAEIYWTAAGKRIFNVAINGSNVLSNLDLFANTGGINKATVKQFTAQASNSGQFVIAFTPSADNAICSAIEIVPPTLATPGGLSASGGAGKVTLAWNAVAGATGYNVKRSTTVGGPYATVSTPTTNDFVDSGVTGGTPYYYIVTATTSGNESGASSEVTATPMTPLQAWRMANFSTMNPDDSTAGDTAAPRGDGVTNLMKYALGLDPSKPADPASLPRPGMSGDGHLTFTFTRLAADTDITYRIEASDDMAAWTEIWNSTTTPYGGGNNASEQVVVTDPTPISDASKKARFLRLKITRP